MSLSGVGVVGVRERERERERERFITCTRFLLQSFTSGTGGWQGPGLPKFLKNPFKFRNSYHSFHMAPQYFQKDPYIFWKLHVFFFCAAFPRIFLHSGPPTKNPFVERREGSLGNWKVNMTL